MGLLIAIVLGALVGWVAGKIMHTDQEQGAVGNIVVGIVGALIGNLVVAPLVGFHASLTGANDTIGELILSLLVALAGACVLLAVVNLVRGRKVR